MRPSSNLNGLILSLVAIAWCSSCANAVITDCTGIVDVTIFTSSVLHYSSTDIIGFGNSSCSLGDVNGDGIDDMALGVPFLDAYEGGVYIAFLNQTTTNVSIVSSTHIIPPHSGATAMGVSVTGLGDVDANGIPDLAAGATQLYYDAGVVYILLLSSTGNTTISVVNNAAYYEWGKSIALVSGRLAIAQEATVYFESVNWQTGDVNGYISFSTSDFNLNGNTGFGAAVCEIGDLDGDGFGEIAIGNPNGNNANGSGLVAVLMLRSGWGNPNNYSYIYVVANQSQEQGMQFGSSLVGVGDADGNGVPDIAVGMPVGSTVYLVYFYPTNPLSYKRAPFLAPSGIGVGVGSSLGFVGRWLVLGTQAEKIAFVHFAGCALSTHTSTSSPLASAPTPIRRSDAASQCGLAGYICCPDGCYCCLPNSYCSCDSATC